MAKKKFDIKSAGLKAAGLGSGAIVGTVLNKPLSKLDPKIRSAAKIAVGAFAPTFAPKSKFVEHVGDGMIAVGAVELAKALIPGLPVSGIGEMDDEFDDLAGLGEVEEYDEFDDLAGVDDDTAIGADEDNSIGEIDDDENYDDYV